MTVENWTRENLEHLIGQEETSSLEFKRSEALSNTDPHKKELVKDVTALANAAGGIIVYGIVEQNGTATELDDGCEAAPEWIEQVLDSNAEPKVAGLVVKRILIAPGRYAFAIEVPQATSLAPHQSKQHHQYFRRHGRRVLPMLDHEVRDLMRRGSAPHLHLMYAVTHLENDRFRVAAAIGNKSSAPAEYGSVLLGFSANLAPPAQIGDFIVNDLPATAGPAQAQLVFRTYSRNFVSPNHLPIFKEQNWAWLTLDVSIPATTAHPLYYTVACPGFSHTRAGLIYRGQHTFAEIRWQDDLVVPQAV